LIFESFLYPYFQKDTLFAIGDYLLPELYNYLADCCRRIKLELKCYDVPLYDTVFHWNKVPGKDNKKFFLHLKEHFNLVSVDSCEIEKNGDKGDTITVKTSAAPILMRYDRDKEKVIAMSSVRGEFKEMEYSTSKLGSDIQVGMPLPKGDIVEDDKKQIQQIIYEFVYDLSSSASNPEKSREFSYYCKILSQDKKFMAAVEDIYKNRHKGFENGYQMLSKNI
jgi:hypothetical protein